MNKAPVLGLFVDVETTGLDPVRHELIELHVFYTLIHHDKIEVLHEEGVRRHPQFLETASPEALRINGYSREAWDAAGAVSFFGFLSFLDNMSSTVDRLSQNARTTMWAGHNVKFDLGFINEALRETGTPDIAADHHAIDTSVLALPLLLNGTVERLSLRPLVEALELPVRFEEHHSARTDALAALLLAGRLLGVPVTSAEALFPSTLDKVTTP
jgi:DNA polymerase III epsilon subunit-like protein